MVTSLIKKLKLSTAMGPQPGLSNILSDPNAEIDYGQRGSDINSKPKIVKEEATTKQPAPVEKPQKKDPLLAGADPAFFRHTPPSLADRLRGVFKNSQDDDVRVIIEGGYQDDWSRHNMDTDRYVIPKDSTTVNLGKEYDLDLVAKLKEDGTIERVHVDPKNRITAKIDYIWLTRIQRPRILITEDGRIFFDIVKMNDDHNRSFLPHLLGSFTQDKEDFDTAYTKYGGK